MKTLNRHHLCGFLIIGVLGFACSDKKAFSGGAKAGAAPKSDEHASEPVERAPESDPEIRAETTNVFKDCGMSGNSPFSAKLYKLKKDTKQLPEDFSKLTPIKDICLKQIDITPRSFDEGFPNVDDLREWFSLNFKFTVQVEKAGEYTFGVNSDDGSKLLIDGVVVIDHDGLHSPELKEGKVTLKAGIHKFNVQYYQGPANKIALELFWLVPGASRPEYIPANLVTRDE